jgi:DNA-binding winged helix-turn-helix (wHTH) protein
MLSQTSSISSELDTSAAAKKALEYARILFEKCELKKAREAYLEAFELSKKLNDSAALSQSISGLLRLAAEASDAAAILVWDHELDLIMQKAPLHTLPLAWYCKGVVASYQNEHRKAFRYYLKALKFCKQVMLEDQSVERRAEFVRIWSNLASVLLDRKHTQRAEHLTTLLLKKFENENLPGINGPLFMLHGLIEQDRGDYDAALAWFHKAHSSFLRERHWYFHLYILFAYAKIARLQRNYVQAYWNLDLMDKATTGAEFGMLRGLNQLERNRLENDAIDLLIDSRKCEISTREAKGMALGKQYVLLGILEALTDAHRKNELDTDRGLSKSEIIEKVWKEKYRPEAHDNKLYYNINRLRKLIEPDMKHPQYLLNWKEGYRLAPGLKVHFVGGSKIQKGKLLS